MMHDIYQLVTLDDGVRDSARILSVLQDIGAGRLHNDLVLLNYYFEMPISFKVKNIKVIDDSAEVESSHHQTVVMKFAKQTLLKSAHFPAGLGVHSYTGAVNVNRNLGVLTRFAYAQILAERRQSVRVRVNREYPVMFRCDGQVCKGRLVDLSVTGMAVQFAHPFLCEVTARGQLLSSLEGMHLKTDAVVLRTKSDDQGGVRVTFMLEPDKKADTVVSHFIYMRQVEIVQDIKDQYLNQEGLL